MLPLIAAGLSSVAEMGASELVGKAADVGLSSGKGGNPLSGLLNAIAPHPGGSAPPPDAKPHEGIGGALLRSIMKF